MECTIQEIGIYIFFGGVFFMLLLQLCPPKYTLTKGALATTVGNSVGAYMLPTHLLNKRGKTLKVLSFLLYLVGLIVIFFGE